MNIKKIFMYNKTLLKNSNNYIKLCYFIKIFVEISSLELFIKVTFFFILYKSFYRGYVSLSNFLDKISFSELWEAFYFKYGDLIYENNLEFKIKRESFNLNIDIKNSNLVIENINFQLQDLETKQKHLEKKLFILSDRNEINIIKSKLEILIYEKTLLKSELNEIYEFKDLLEQIKTKYNTIYSEVVKNFKTLENQQLYDQWCKSQMDYIAELEEKNKIIKKNAEKLNELKNEVFPPSTFEKIKNWVYNFFSSKNSTSNNQFDNFEFDKDDGNSIVIENEKKLEELESRLKKLFK